MRHHNTVTKFGRVRKVRVGFMRSLTVALIERGRIMTTEPRAKALRPVIEKLVTQARDNSLASRRLILSRLNNNEMITKMLIEDIAPRYMERPGGYTRIVKLPRRGSDAAPMAVIECV